MRSWEGVLGWRRVALNQEEEAAERALGTPAPLPDSTLGWGRAKGAH